MIDRDRFEEEEEFEESFEDIPDYIMLSYKHRDAEVSTTSVEKVIYHTNFYDILTEMIYFLGNCGFHTDSVDEAVGVINKLKESKIETLLDGIKLGGTNNE